ncbi:MAG: metalloregulator ArsR/SmtB family transcription factor [Opitutaceae bacterium]|jgi:ArsR family transcriptional regulator
MPKTACCSKPKPADYRAVANVFKALSHPSRLLMVDALSGGERCVADLTEMIGCDISTVSNHLTVLRHAGVVASERRGAQIFYRVEKSCVLDAYRCLLKGECGKKE